MADESAVHVNFARPVAIFPLDGVTLYPHQVVPLHIFEARYRQMVSDVLDSSGLIAMAVYDIDTSEGESTPQASDPPLRRAVCIGHVVRHEKLPDGRYNILLQGVCRARIMQELPREGPRMYRSAMLEPTEPSSDAMKSSSPIMGQMDEARSELGKLLGEGELRRLVAAEPLLEYIRNEDISTPAVLELVASVLAREPGVRYELLAEANPGVRANTLLTELRSLERIVRLAVQQHPEKWPKGMSWN